MTNLTIPIKTTSSSSTHISSPCIETSNTNTHSPLISTKSSKSSKSTTTYLFILILFFTSLLTVIILTSLFAFHSISSKTIYQTSPSSPSSPPSPTLTTLPKFISIIDSGSTGNRIYIYKALSPISFSLQNNPAETKTHTGLAEFNNVQDISLPLYLENCLQGLITTHKTFIKDNNILKDDIVLLLRATGGMRALDGDKSTMIIEGVRSLFESAEITYDKPEIIRAQDEGYFSMLAFMDSIEDSSKSELRGMAEMGGASFQISYFLYSSGKENNKNNKNNKIKLNKFLSKAYMGGNHGIGKCCIVFTNPFNLNNLNNLNNSDNSDNIIKLKENDFLNEFSQNIILNRSKRLFSYLSNKDKSIENIVACGFDNVGVRSTYKIFLKESQKKNRTDSNEIISYCSPKGMRFKTKSGKIIVGSYDKKKCERRIENIISDRFHSFSAKLEHISETLFEEEVKETLALTGAYSYLGKLFGNLNDLPGLKRNIEKYCSGEFENLKKEFDDEKEVYLSEYCFMGKYTTFLLEIMKIGRGQLNMKINDWNGGNSVQWTMGAALSYMRGKGNEEVRILSV